MREGTFSHVVAIKSSVSKDSVSGQGKALIRRANESYLIWAFVEHICFKSPFSRCGLCTYVLEEWIRCRE